MSRTPWPSLRRNLVAILRGITPADGVAVGEALVAAGFEAIEVPLNSPDPFVTIEAMIKALPSNVIVGAGTVLTTQQVDQLHAIGGRLMVSPNVNADVIRAADGYGMVTMPGVFTATEALQALAAGASGLKFFPASALGPNGITAIRAILPAGTIIGAVGGVSDADFAAYAAAGVKAFGLGGSLYKPGSTAAEVGLRAKAAVAAYDAL